VPGSPTNALHIEPPFDVYHFIDMDREKVQALSEQAKKWGNVDIYEGDCNEILLNRIYPQVQFADYKRALCILDPYRLQLKWKIVEQAGKMGSIDIFINFPIMAINRTVLHKNPENVYREQIEKLNEYWGDESWKKAAYSKVESLFGPVLRKNPNYALAEAFRQRLKSVAGFRYVPKPMIMRNSKNAAVYYLYFASQKGVAGHIVEEIFDKWGRV
jgi:three-Cys-motif partner protein